MAAENFQPPQPVGEPFRGDPSDPVPFAVEGGPAVPAPSNDPLSPWANEPAFPAAPSGPPSHSQPAPPATGQRQLPPQFRQPPPPPLDPKAAQAQRVAKLGLASGIASIFFFWPIFGPIAIGLGINAVRKGERRLGGWAISTGVAGTLIGIIVTALVIGGVVDPDQLIQNLKNQR